MTPDPKSYPATPEGVGRAVCDAIPWVRGVGWRFMAPGMGVAELRLAWWAWLFPVVSHAVAAKRARQAIDRYAPPGSVFLVKTWG